MTQKTKTLSRVGAGALAVATVAAGLSFGPATAANAATGDSAPFKLVYKHPTQNFWYSVTPSTVAGNASSSVTTTSAAAGLAAAADLVYNTTTKQVRIKDTNTCLYNTPRAGFTYDIAPFGTCATGSEFQWTPTSTGNISPVNRPTFSIANSVGTSIDGKSVTVMATAVPGPGPLQLIDGAGIPKFNASVKSVDVNARTAELTGFGVPGAQVIIDDTHQVDVESDGTWSYTATGLKLGQNTLKVEQYEGSQKTGETSVVADLKVAPVTIEGTFDQDVTKPLILSGTAQPGADVTVANSQGWSVTVKANATTGAYQVAAKPSSDGRDILTYSAKQSIGGEDAPGAPAAVNISFGTPVSITSPVNDLVHPGGPLRFQGRGSIAANGGGAGKVELREKGKQGVIGSGTVLANGVWTIDAANIPDKKATYVATQTARGNNISTAEVTLNPDADSTKDVTLTSPVSGSEFDANTAVTFRGEGEPDATITVDPGAGLAPVTTKVGENGEWSVPKFLGNGKYTFTIKQVAGDKTSFVNNVVLTPKATAPINKPWAVTTPTSGSTANGPVAFSGTGRAGETVTIHNTTFASADVTTKVGNDGNWSVSRYVGTGHYSFDVTQTNAAGTVTGQTTGIEINKPAGSNDKPFAVTSAPSGDVATGLFTFAGTGKVGATVTLAPTTGQAPVTAIVDDKGNWSVSKFIGTSRYDFKVSMTKGDVTENLANIVVTGK